MRILLIFTLLFTVNFNVKSQVISNSENLDTSLYVWAKNGLNIRSGPGTDHNIMGSLNYGDEVRVIEITEVSYNINGTPYEDSCYYNYSFELIAPFILYGNWLKVKTGKGEIGYVISQYLLKIKPLIHDEVFDVPLPIVAIDSIYSDTKPNDKGFYNNIKYTYLNNVTQFNTNGNVWSEIAVEFTGFSIQEVFVIMDVRDEDIQVVRNWKNELRLDGYEGMCSILITKEGEKVTYLLMCSC